MDFKVIHIEETDSTNRWLRDYSSSQSVGECIVVSDYQSAGKGCGKNTWESERGKNLTFSMLIHPKNTEGTPLQAHRQFFITEIISVALCETLESFLYNKVEIKWPNDIYVGDKKICGILIENRIKGGIIMDSIIGIGLNVNQKSFLSDAPNPVSMSQLGGMEFDCNEVLSLFIKTLGNVITRETAISDYRNRLYRKSGTYEFQDATGRFLAQIVRVENDGHLVLKDSKDEERVYSFKEVQFLI